MYIYVIYIYTSDVNLYTNICKYDSCMMEMVEASLEKGLQNTFFA